MAARISMWLFLATLLLLLVGSSTASSTTAAQTLDTQTNSAVAEDVQSLNLEEHRKLSVYALYNLDKFNVRFLTAKTDELERASANQKGGSDIGNQWTLVSETGGVQSSLSYPLRTVTQEFLYVGFQNLIDDWMLELSGGPDGDNDLSYRNVTNGGNGLRLLQIAEGPQGQVYNIDSGDSTGEEDYNDIGLANDSIGAEIEVDTVETIPDSQEQQQPQAESTPIPNTTDVESSGQEESTTTPIDDESPATEEEQPESTPVRTPTEIAPSATQASPNQPTSTYVNIYEGLAYHSMYEHLVTVDLRVKLYLRKDGYSSDLDSVRRNLREETGVAELLAEVTPTIAFLEPVSEAKRLNKPSNSDVRELFGGWMEYMFGKQRSVYLRTLREYPDQALLQEISTLKVDVSVSSSPLSVAAASSSSSGTTGAWSETTQRVLVSALIVLGIVAVIWPMYAYGQHMKKNREISLQLMNVDLDEYDFSDSFGSVTYKDNFEDMVKLPPINPSVPAPNGFSLPRPQALSLRANSLDAARHGKDVFPTRNRDISQKSAMSALEASDRYLSRHRPDLFYDQQSSESKGMVNVFGRSYEIPSNPFELIYNVWDQSSPQAQQPTDTISPLSGGSDLGRNAHFPFASPRSSFTPRPASVGNNPYGRSTSVGSVGSAGNANHFSPIVENLAAGISEEEEMNGIPSSAPGIAAHTGHSWQNNEMAFSQQIHSPVEGSGSVIGNIFRNLSISSYFNDNTINNNNSYTANSQYDPEFYPTPSSGTEEVYYDDYHHQHQDPLFQREIELESLPHDEESPANYDFAFQDFPRKDGTPCLIIDDDSFLSERKRRESAKMIFNIDDEETFGNKDDGSFSEKKLDDIPVSDEAFKMMLSQNALDIDNSVIQVDGSDDMMVLPPLESSFLNRDPHDAKSPEFQQKLSRLMETKQQRYARENKNNAIVAEKRKKRKNVRERERVDRHKAIERELEDIEAEFSLTMQPLSPNRNKTSTSNNHGHHTPKRNAQSPKPPGGRYSPMPSRRTASPGRKNIATLSPTRSNVSTIAANSPARSSMGRNRGNSLGGSHKRQNSLGASPFRTYKPRTRHSSGHVQSHSIGGNSDIFRKAGTGGSEGVSRSASQRSASPPGSLTFDGSAIDFKPKFRPTNRFSGNYDDLSLPAMTIDGEKDAMSNDAKFRSPQAVIDEVMQSGAMQKPRHYHQPKRSLTPTRHHHQRSLTPSKMIPATSRRTNSFDVSDDIYQRRAPPSGPSRQSPSAKPNGNSSHRRARSGSIGSNHRRTSSRDDDIFLHGVVAQTRFI